LSKFGSSYIALLSSVVNDFTFFPWKFPSLPKTFWKSLENRKSYAEWLVEEVGLKDKDELAYKHFLENHGKTLMSLYGYSVRAFLASLEPSTLPLSINPTEKRKVPRLVTPRNYWASFENKKAFVEELGEMLGFGEDLKQWYGVSAKDFAANKGGGLLKLYHGSPYLLLKEVYPTFDWVPWKFTTAPRNLTKQVDNVRLVCHTMPVISAISFSLIFFLSSWCHISRRRWVCGH